MSETLKPCPLCDKKPYGWGREGWIDCETNDCPLRGVQMSRAAWQALPRWSVLQDHPQVVINMLEAMIDCMEKENDDE